VLAAVPRQLHWCVGCVGAVARRCVAPQRPCCFSVRAQMRRLQCVGRSRRTSWRSSSTSSVLRRGSRCLRALARAR
jgi:hypothetical protein